MPNFDVEFFEKSDGTFPAEEFILSQDVKMQAKLFRLLELLEVNLPKRLKKHHPEKLNCPRSIVPNMNSERRIYNGQKL